MAELLFWPALLAYGEAVVAYAGDARNPGSAGRLASNPRVAWVRPCRDAGGPLVVCEGLPDAYTAAAFRLYRNYDGRLGAFSNTSVRATTSDVANTSIYAAIADQDASVLHVILLNKNPGALDVRFQIAGGQTYTSGDVWGFGPGSPGITERGRVSGISGNAFHYVLPGMTALHLVLR